MGPLFCLWVQSRISEDIRLIRVNSLDSLHTPGSQADGIPFIAIDLGTHLNNNDPRLKIHSEASLLLSRHQTFKITLTGIPGRSRG